MTDREQGSGRSESRGEPVWTRIVGRAPEGLLAWTDLMLMTRQLPGQRSARPGGLAEYTSWHPAIQQVNDNLGRGIPEARLRARLQHGMRFYVLRERDRIVGSAWLATGPERFIDEAAIGLAIPANGLWLRDIFVPPSERGRGRFGQVLDAALSCHPGATSLWSDVRLSNASSVRAHLSYGFRPAGTVRALHVAQRVLVRTAAAGSVPIRSIWAPGRWLMWTGRGFREFVQARLA